MANEVQRRFLNIKVRRVRKKTHIVLDWREPTTQEDWEKRGLDCPVPATETFYEALANLKPYVLKWMAAALNIDPDNVAAEVKVLGASYTYDEQGGYHVVVSATVPVPGFTPPLVLNFPQVIPDKNLKTILDDLEIEASSYIEGERGQLELPLPEEGADDDATQQ